MKTTNILPFVRFVGKTTLLFCIKMYITAPDIDDSWLNSLIYWWVSLGFDKLWCNYMIVTWIFLFCTLRTWGFDILAANYRIYYFQSIMKPSSRLLMLMHRNRLQPSRGMDNPGCCCSFCQTKIEAGIRAKNNFVFVFDDWPFQRRSILAASQKPSLYLIHCVNSRVSAKIVCACLRAACFFCSLNPSSYGPFADCEWPLCFASE